MESSLLIIGTGALACLFAARLSNAGVNVSILGTWKEGLAALKKHGVRSLDPSGAEICYPVTASNRADSFPKAEFALVLVKSWQTERAGRMLVDCLAQDGVALTLQNGLGNWEILNNALGSDRVALGVTTTGAALVAPGFVRPGGEGVISIGEHPRIRPLVAVLSSADFIVEIHHDLPSLQWGKLVINAAINPLTGILRVPNGELLTRVHARSIMGQIALETAAVARSAGIELPFSDPVEMAEQVARRTAINHSSMYQDMIRGAPTEIDAICGEIVRNGRRTGAPTPLNEFFWHLIKAAANHSGDGES